jgi:peptidoglycan/LPS O-acetylase OafA/YrhL
MKNFDKLNQLTALRFFAAFMIVIHHSQGSFGIKNIGINLGQGVSFFFVLSGFILAYVYPNLTTFSEVKKFWRARIARIYPAYFASFVLGFFLVPYVWNTKIALTNLLMFQSWVPLSKYYFSYNAVAWSVSTEAFFYLVFPLLIYRWNKYWKIIFLLVGMALVSLLYILSYLQLPDYEGESVTMLGLVYINPISRLFEFVSGMAVATLWRKKKSSLKTYSATFCEIGALAICAISICYGNYIAELSNAGIVFWASTALWLSHCGSLFAFSLLIYIIAYGRGLISKILSIKPFVFLGEISYSTYLIHQILMTLFLKDISTFAWASNSLLFLIYIVILLICSYLMWKWIEIPGRRFLLANVKIHRTSIIKTNWWIYVQKNKSPIIACLVLYSIIDFAQRLTSKHISIDTQAAEALTSAKFKPYLGANFENIFTLRGLNVECKNSTLIVKLAWEKKELSNVRFNNAIHLINSTGNILNQADYKQPKNIPSSNPGYIWLDKLQIPTSTIKNGVTGLAIGVYENSGDLLQIQHEKTDWNGRRLIINIESCLNNDKDSLTSSHHSTPNKKNHELSG